MEPPIALLEKAKQIDIDEPRVDVSRVAGRSRQGCLVEHTLLGDYQVGQTRVRDRRGGRSSDPLGRVPGVAGRG